MMTDPKGRKSGGLKQKKRTELSAGGRREEKHSSLKTKKKAGK